MASELAFVFFWKLHELKIQLTFYSFDYSLQFALTLICLPYQCKSFLYMLTVFVCGSLIVSLTISIDLQSSEVPNNLDNLQKAPSRITYSRTMSLRGLQKEPTVGYFFLPQIISACYYYSYSLRICICTLTVYLSCNKLFEGVSFNLQTFTVFYNLATPLCHPTFPQ